MAGLEDILGAGDAIKQVFMYGLLQQVITQAFQPYFEQISQLVNSAHPDMVLSAADVATAVNRSFMTAEAGQAEAAKSGVDAERFNIMRDLAGDAPGPQELAAAVMRGIIEQSGSGPDSTSFEQGIAEGNLLDKWAPIIYKLAEALLSPADAASAVVRNFMTAEAGLAEAAKSGVSADLFNIMVHLSGDAPAPGQLAEALRRGIIPVEGTGADSTSFNQGIAEGRLADKWASVIQALSKAWPTPTQAIDSALKGQITQAEGQSLYEKLGGDPQFYKLLLDSAGNAPTPLEALNMAYRGAIPFTGTGPDVVSFEQAFLEGPWRDKWMAPYRQLGEYIPPPETVRTLLEQGAIDKATAAKWWAASGMPQSTIEEYLKAAAFNNTAATRGLTVTSVLDMYYAQLQSRADTAKLLAIFGVPPTNAEELLAYVDMRRAIAAVNSAVTRIQTLFITHKITENTARDALTRLKIPASTISDILQTWLLAESANVRTLTESQITDAFYYQIMPYETALQELQNIGYTPYDAYVLLSNKAKGPLPNPPPRIVGVPSGQVIPGLT